MTVAPAGAEDELLTQTRNAPKMPAPARTEVGGTRWGRYIAVSGGIVEAEGSYAATADLLLYHLRSKTWSRGPDLPGLRDHAPLVALDRQLYLVGGYTTGLATPTTEVWRLDHPTARWKRVADLEVPRAALAVVAVSGQLLAIGGFDGTSVLRSTEVYDPQEDEWSPGPDLAIPREHTGAAVVDERVFAIGGRNPVNLTSVEVLKTGVAGLWSTAPDLMFSRGGNAASSVNHVPCTAGGEEAAGTIAPIECLQGGEWVHLADLRVPRHGLAVVGVGRSLHVISGGPEPGAFYSTTHEVLRV